MIVEDLQETRNQDWSQVNQFLQPRRSKYWAEEPSLTQKVFLRTMAQEVLFGGAAGGGKSSALLMSALQFVDVPGYSAILFRKTFTDLALPGSLMDRFVMWIRDFDDEVHWQSNSRQATFPSGARITFGYLNQIRDFERYKSSEYQFIGMDEVTEIRESDYVYLFSRLRRPRTGPLSEVPLRMRCASNPAPNWVRQRFLIEGEEKGRLFIPSKLTDNPGVDKESYLQMLKELPPLERAQLEHGDWYSTTLGTLFRREDFVMMEPNEMPKVDQDTQTVRFWDLAATKPSQANPDPDWTVGVLGYMQDGKFYILDIKRIRDTSSAVENLVKETAEKDGKNVAIRMEMEPGSAGLHVVDQYARKVLEGYDFTGVRATGEKSIRARPLAAAVGNGNVHVKIAPWNSDFLDEMTSFPEGHVHDDMVDAAVWCFYCCSAGDVGKKELKVLF